MAPKNTPEFASLVRTEMARSGLTQADVQRLGGPSDTTLRKIIDADPVGLSPSTLIKVDTALRWEQGSASRFLATGAEPVRVSSGNTHSDRVESHPFAGEASAFQRLVEDIQNGTIRPAQRVRRGVAQEPRALSYFDALRNLQEAIEAATEALQVDSAEEWFADDAQPIADRLSAMQNATLDLLVDQMQRQIARLRQLREGDDQEASYAERLGVSDILDLYKASGTKQDRVIFKALWDAGYRQEHSNLIRSAFSQAKNMSHGNGTQFWKAVASQLGGSYGIRGWQLPPAPELRSHDITSPAGAALVAYLAAWGDYADTGTEFLTALDEFEHLPVAVVPLIAASQEAIVPVVKLIDGQAFHLELDEVPALERGMAEDAIARIEAARDVAIGVPELIKKCTELEYTNADVRDIVDNYLRGIDKSARELERAGASYEELDSRAVRELAAVGSNVQEHFGSEVVRMVQPPLGTTPDTMVASAHWPDGKPVDQDESEAFDRWRSAGEPDDWRSYRGRAEDHELAARDRDPRIKPEDDGGVGVGEGPDPDGPEVGA